MSDSVRKNVAENYKLKPSMIKSKKTSERIGMQESLEEGGKEKEEKEQNILSIQKTIQEASRIREEDEAQMDVFF